MLAGELPTISWPEHGAMEAGDVVITVEHCHGCHRHRMTTRHDPEVSSNPQFRADGLDQCSNDHSVNRFLKGRMVSRRHATGRERCNDRSDRCVAMPGSTPLVDSPRRENTAIGKARPPR